MALVWERLMLAFLQTLVPSIRNIHIPFEWAFTQSAIISLENPQPGMVRNISAQLWSLPWFRSARFLIFIAADTPPDDLSRVAWQSINGSDATHDVIHDTVSGRIAIDATDSRLQRTKITVSEELAALVSRCWKEYTLP
jgi:UbiD family decarboxylase